MAKNKINLVKMLSVASSLMCNFLDTKNDQYKDTKENTETNTAAQAKLLVIIEC